MSITNKALNTGSLTNKERGSASLTWDDATFSWDSGVGSWDNPYNFNNKALNTASLTNIA